MITGRQLRAARALAGVDQIGLAKKAGVSVGTVRRLESFDDALVGCNVATLNRVKAALGQGGVVFIDGGVQMKTLEPSTRRSAPESRQT